MIPKNLIIENFMSHSKSEIDFRCFSTALILGENLSNPEESNGVGKSTIIHALNFAMFGEYPTSIIEKIIREGATKASVIFEFEVDKNDYQITRERTKKNSLVKFCIKENDEWKDLSELRNSESTAELLKVLKISFVTYKNAYCFQQDDMNDLLSLKSAKDRLNILKTSFNLSIYDKLTKKVSELSAENNKSLFAENKVLESIGSPEEDLKINLQKIDDTNRILNSKHQELEHLKAKLAEKDSALIELSSEIIPEDDLTPKINVAKAEIISLKNKIEKFKNDILSNEKRYNESIQKKDTTISKKESLESSLEELSKVKLLDKQALLSESKSIDDEILSIQKEISVLEFNLKKLNHPITSEEVCPECQQEVPPSYRQQHEIKTNEEIKKINDKLLSSKDNLRKQSAKKEKHNLVIFEQDQTKSKIAKINSDLSNIDELIESFNKNAEQSSLNIKSLKQDVLNTENLLLDKQANLQILEEKQVNNPNLSSDNKKKIIELKNEINNLNASIEAFQRSISQGETNLIILNEKIANNKVSIEKKIASEEKLKKFEGMKNQLQILQQGFGPLGAPNLVVTSILDEFQKNTNYWLSKLRNSLEVQFNISKIKAGIEEDTFNVNFFYNGQEFDLSQLSGGQKFIIKISLKLGLIDTLENKFNLKMNLLCFDEVDEHIDISASKAFFEIIKELEKENKILIITHKELLKEKFNNYIVVKSDGKSSFAELKK